MKHITIRNVYGEFLFYYKKENNTIKDTVEQAVKEGVSLCNANLYGANLQCADLRGADLRRANLIKANLKWANLRGADLSRSGLIEADLEGANLKGIKNIYSACLMHARNIPYLPLACPSEGEFMDGRKSSFTKRIIKVASLLSYLSPKTQRGVPPLLRNAVVAKQKS